MMKKKKSKKHLDFYISCMNHECRMPFVSNKYYGGLCGMAEENLISQPLFDFYFKDGQSDYSYWADGLPGNQQERYSKFTGLRQTIVLLLAAINNEL